jgi:hypothetical protein
VCDKDAENAIASGRCIEKMLSVNYADVASITPARGTTVNMVDDADGEETAVYTGGVLDIVLPKAERINVFAIGELIEAGERITSFKLERVNVDGSCDTLCEGTSVGFYRAVQIEDGEYDHLRFSVTGSMAAPLLKKVGLHYYEAPADVEVIRRGDDIVKSIESIGDGCTVDVEFGGIYPFDTVSFNMKYQGYYKIYAFDGAEFYEIANGWEGDYIVDLNLGRVIDSSYQIKIWCQTGFRDEPKFKIF